MVYNDRNNLTPKFDNHAKETLESSTKTEKAPEQNHVRPMFGHRLGIFDTVIFAACIGCLAGILLTHSMWFKWTLSGTTVLLMLSPFIAQRIALRRKFGLASILRAFRKMGINPELEGNELRWDANGAKNIVRLVNGCQLQICREYVSDPELMPKFTAAASATMTQVFSAKIGAYHENEQTLNIYFATEMLCSSIKEFDKIYSASVDILNEAESRQKANLMRLIDSEKSENNKPKKIGFHIG